MGGGDAQATCQTVLPIIERKHRVVDAPPGFLRQVEGAVEITRDGGLGHLCQRSNIADRGGFGQVRFPGSDWAPRFIHEYKLASAPSCSAAPAVQCAPVSGCSHSRAPASRFLPAWVYPERFATGTALHAQPAGSRPPGPASRHLHALRHEYVVDVAFPITDANDVRVF